MLQSPFHTLSYATPTRHPTTTPHETSHSFHSALSRVHSAGFMAQSTGNAAASAGSLCVPAAGTRHSALAGCQQQEVGGCLPQRTSAHTQRVVAAKNGVVRVRQPTGCAADTPGEHTQSLTVAAPTMHICHYTIPSHGVCAGRSGFVKPTPRPPSPSPPYPPVTRTCT